MAKLFKVGETKDVGVEFRATDGSTFTISSATYEVKIADGTVLTSGNASIDGANVWASVTADAAGSMSVEFIITVTPSDVGKNIEVHKPTVEIQVK